MDKEIRVMASTKILNILGQECGTMKLNDAVFKEEYKDLIIKIRHFIKKSLEKISGILSVHYRVKAGQLPNMARSTVMRRRTVVY